MTTSAARTVAVVLAAHGDRGGEAPNAVLLAHRAALAGEPHFHSVTAGVLKGEPSLEAALSAAQNSGATRIAVYPMFMADGYFTRTVLPQRIAALGLTIDLTILPPLGLDPRLPDLMLAGALAAAARHSLVPETSRLLVVGHGSQLGPASANVTRSVADAIARAAPFAIVATAFLEEAELLEDALRDDRLPTIVSGFFSGDGMHAGEDVPGAIASSGSAAIYAGSIGASPALAEIIRSAVAARLEAG